MKSQGILVYKTIWNTNLEEGGVNKMEYLDIVYGSDVYDFILNMVQQYTVLIMRHQLLQPASCSDSKTYKTGHNVGVDIAGYLESPHFLETPH